MLCEALKTSLSASQYLKSEHLKLVLQENWQCGVLIHKPTCQISLSSPLVGQFFSASQLFCVYVFLFSECILDNILPAFILPAFILPCKQAITGMAGWVSPVR